MFSVVALSNNVTDSCARNRNVTNRNEIMKENNSTALVIKRSNTVKESRASAGVSYHEFLINEASYKFWAIFQLVTVAVLLYSTFAAIYFARYNYLMNLESGDYDDLLFARSLSTFQNYFLPLNTQTFQEIVDAISGIINHEFDVHQRD
ncbi:hypothetical protein PGB90_010245 [Kerria lacca]